jgi:uncharacterized protein YjiS (DUF1127 family)
MRNFALFQAESQQAATSGAGRLLRMWKNWKRRRRVRRLTELDDVILDDIGLNREDVYWVGQLSLGYDPVAELARLRRGSRSNFWKI